MKKLKISEFGTKKIEKGVKGYRLMSQKESAALNTVFEHFKNSLNDKTRELYELMEPIVSEKVKSDSFVRIANQAHNAKVVVPSV